MHSPDDIHQRLGELRTAILGGPEYLSAFRSLPFAIFVYSPKEEFELRVALKGLVGELRRNSLDIVELSLAKLVYEAVARSPAEDGGWERIYEGERKRRNCKTAVQTVQHILRTEARLADVVVEQLAQHDPTRTVTFLCRIGALHPAYRPSSLLAELANRIAVPTILLYPGRCPPEGGIEFLEHLPSDASSYARIFR